MQAYQYGLGFRVQEFRVGEERQGEHDSAAHTTSCRPVLNRGRKYLTGIRVGKFCTITHRQSTLAAITYTMTS